MLNRSLVGVEGKREEGDWRERARSPNRQTGKVSGPLLRKRLRVSHARLLKGNSDYTKMVRIVFLNFYFFFISGYFLIFGGLIVEKQEFTPF